VLYCSLCVHCILITMFTDFPRANVRLINETGSYPLDKVNYQLEENFNYDCIVTHTIKSEACDRSQWKDVVYFINTDINPSHCLTHLLAQLRQTSHQSVNKCAAPPPSLWGASPENVRACLYMHLVDFRMLLSCF